MSSFIYLGDFSSILPYDRILNFVETAKWQQVCSSKTEHTKNTRPVGEQEQSYFYNEWNSSRFEVTVKDQNLISATSGEAGISDLLEMLGQALKENTN